MHDQQNIKKKNIEVFHLTVTLHLHSKSIFSSLRTKYQIFRINRHRIRTDQTPFKPVGTAVVFGLLSFRKNQIDETTKSTICVCSITTEPIDRYLDILFNYVTDRITNHRISIFKLLIKTWHSQRLVL